MKNANVLIKTAELDHEQWLRSRRFGIGGSDVGAICGLNRWKSPMAVWVDKTSDTVEDSDPSEAAYWGTKQEELVAQEFSLRTGKKVQRRNAILQHPEYSWMLANLDRVVVGEKAILECKTASEYMKSEWKDDEVPESYILQCQHYLAVTDYDKAYIAVLVGGNKFIWKEIGRDEEIINYLIRFEKEFWNLVETKTPPIMDGSQASTEVLNKMYPNSVLGNEIALPGEAVELIKKRDEVKTLIKDLETQQNEIENKLKAMLQDNETGWVDDIVVNWKSIIANKFDNKTFEKEHPDMYKQYLKSSSYRKFDVKAIKGGK